MPVFRATFLLMLLVAPAALADPAAAPLARGGFAGRQARLDALASDPAALAASLALRSRLDGAIWSVDFPRPVAIPKALGDRLVLSVDDGQDPIGPAWEARLDASGGPAGAMDAVAVRFPAQSLAVSPPFDVSQVIVGLDDRHGATTWPVELWLEDAASPLQPRRGSVSDSGVLDAPAAGLTPSVGPRPTAFRRLAAPLRVRVPDAWLTDGAHDDDFERTDGPLAGPGSDWFECEPTCGRLPLDVDLRSGTAVRTNGGGPLLIVKLPGVAQERQRPHRDLDVRASVRLIDAAPGFGRAGLALRAIAEDAFYRVEYQKTPAQVVVTAVLPAPIGEVPVGTLPIAAPSTGSRLLDVTVTGANPSVRFAISVDGTLLGTITDATYRLTGWTVGLSASNPASSGEAWDDFTVRRRPDVFAVVGFPAGENVGLPLDVSPLSLISQSALVTVDGSDFQPLDATPGCPNPGNPMVQLEVEDAVAGDRLFQREARITSVELDCPTCPRGPAGCPRNLSVAQSQAAALTVGESVTVRASWWDEHLAGDTLILQGSLWTGPCDAATALVTSGATAGVSSAAQAGAARLSSSDVFNFTPGEAGAHCLLLEVFHDSNGDCCPDGAETTPLGGCGGACVPTAPTDSNPSTGPVLVDLTVHAVCANPKSEDIGRDGPDDVTGDGIPDEINLDGASLRVRRGAGPEDIDLAWGVLDPLVFPASYNIHLAMGSSFARTACYPDQAPAARVVVGRTDDQMPLAVPVGDAAWLAVFETDGCGARASVPDASRDDPALRCP